MTPDRVVARGRWENGAAAVVLLALCALTFSYVTTEFTYDESVYLTLARRIVETGLPLRRTFEDITQLQLFENSPPLVMYVAAMTQRWFPGDPVSSRVAHILLFVLPAYGLVWGLTRARFGPLAGLSALLLLIGSGTYVSATSHVQLDVPLGLFAVVTLWAFERAAGAGRVSAWSFVAAGSMAFAVWTKYQAVCIAAAIALYSAYVLVRDRKKALRGLVPPLATQCLVGASAVGLLVGYYAYFGTAARLSETWSFNAGRMATGGVGALATFRAMLATATESTATLGGVAIAAALVAPLVESRHRDLLVLLASYVAATLAFNLYLFQLPGSGTYYLSSVVPAMAVLAGSCASAISRVAGRRPALAVVVLAAVVQFVSVPPPMYMPPYVDKAKLAAEYIATRGRPADGVLATTSAIEFYTGNPVGIITFTSREALLASLDGTGPGRVTFVVVPRGASVAGVETFQAEWEKLLNQHFVEVPASVPGMVIYERRIQAG